MALASWLREKERGSGKESNREKRSVEREQQGEEGGQRVTGRREVWRERNRERRSMEREQQSKILQI